MLEKRFPVVPPQNFTADGTANGVITIANTRLFKVKEVVKITGTALPILELEVKNVINLHQMVVGPITGSILTTTDVSAYTVAAASNVFCPATQKRPNITADDFERAVYEEEPVVAKRVILVDGLGDKYNETNPLPVAATFSGTIQVGDVRITAADNDPVAGDIHSSVRISNGSNDLSINTDGSINANIVSSPSSSPGLQITHLEVSSVVAGVETTLISLVAPPNGYKSYKVDVSGENIALFRVKVNNVSISTKRTFFGKLNETFSFEPFTNGLELNSGDVLTVTVLHTRSMTSNFEVTLMGLNL